MYCVCLIWYLQYLNDWDVGREGWIWDTFGKISDFGSISDKFRMNFGKKKVTWYECCNLIGSEFFAFPQSLKHEGNIRRGNQCSLAALVMLPYPVTEFNFEVGALFCYHTFLLMGALFVYRPPTKLREGNVFIPVYLSVHRGSHVTIAHDALDITVQGTPSPLPTIQAPSQPQPHLY